MNTRLTIMYRPEFIRLYGNLEPSLREECKEKIDMFKDRENHRYLKVHKLHGRLNGRYGFSVNYKYRIVFEYEDKNTAVLMAVGDHDIYN